MRVLVPFGARKVFEVGYVVGLKETSEYKCKNIVKVIDRVFDEEKLELAKWISQKYFCNLYVYIVSQVSLLPGIYNTIKLFFKGKSFLF